MKKVAAYLLERHDGMDSVEARGSEAQRVREEIREWLDKKGATQGKAGTYAAVDGSHATFESEEAGAPDGRSWYFVRLDEIANDGRKFSAALSVTTTDESVVVYVVLELGTNATIVAPLNPDPHCPGIVRTLLGGPGSWTHGGYPVRHRLTRLRGFDEGERLAGEILDPARTLPIVLVSETTGGDLVLPKLDEKLAYDLTGVANVYRIDDDASWALTDVLGRSFCCFGGAVRLFWPRMQISDNRFRHPLWTADRVLGFGGNDFDVRERLRKQLRLTIMDAAALSVVRPRQIDAIRSMAKGEELQALRERANSSSDYAGLAELYAKENDKLRAEVAELQDENAELRLRLQNVEHVLSYQAPTAEPDAITPDEADDEEDEEYGPPAKGELRFYKKVHDTGSHDIMRHVQECGCNNWEGAHKADKAKKGIAKLESGRNDWSNLWHCASCTGGGMWKVKW